MSEKTLYSMNEAASLCGVSRITINRWVKAGKIDAQRVGRTVVIPLAELAKCMKELPGKSREQTESDITVAVKKVVEEYGETLRLLAKE
jgi:excisionase family DNA binding protein